MSGDSSVTHECGQNLGSEDWYASGCGLGQAIADATVPLPAGRYSAYVAGALNVPFNAGSNAASISVQYWVNGTLVATNNDHFVCVATNAYTECGASDEGATFSLPDCGTLEIKVIHSASTFEQYHFEFIHLQFVGH